jgi:DsbC/DsbD-like thiol-disulfide interchange protein
VKRLISTLLTLLLPLVATAADKKPGDAATLEAIEVKGDAKAGAAVTVVIKVKLEKTYHTHSNKPSEPNFIATALTLDAPAGIKVGDITYPKGKSQKVAGIDKPLSVYEGGFEILVVLALDAKTPPPLVVPATLRYQACQGAVCYPPQRLKFDIKLPARK